MIRDISLYNGGNKPLAREHAVYLEFRCIHILWNMIEIIQLLYKDKDIIL